MSASRSARLRGVRLWEMVISERSGARPSSGDGMLKRIAPLSACPPLARFGHLARRFRSGVVGFVCAFPSPAFAEENTSEEAAPPPTYAPKKAADDANKQKQKTDDAFRS